MTIDKVIDIIGNTPLLNLKKTTGLNIFARPMPLIREGVSRIGWPNT